MDLVKGFTDFQRRNAKQQKQPTDGQTGAAKQEKQATFCRFCKWGKPDLTAASYLQHLKDAHGDVLDKTELTDETTHVNWKEMQEIDNALDRVAKDADGNGRGNTRGRTDKSPASSLRRQNSRSVSPPKRAKGVAAAQLPSEPAMKAPYNDPEFSRRTTPKGTLWNPDPEGLKFRSRQPEQNGSAGWGRTRTTPTRPARSGHPPPGGGGGDRFNNNPGVLPAPAYGLPGQDTTSIMIKQPETRPISQEQLVAEVKGIYAGLVMVESKCIEVDTAQAEAPASSKLNPEQWQALIALHRTLLHEHHDFFLASQHPSASPALKRLASKYAMPARMWRHGIHAFLELLRARLPASQEYMMTFIYLSYSMMALLCETVPAFEDTWIECLGDLGRYRMAIEEEKPRDREVWTNVSIQWYSKAADKAPTTGRLYHHLAILTRPNAIQQLFYYTKSLCVAIRFDSTRESIMTLLDPIMDHEAGQPSRLSQFDIDFVRCHGILFSGKHQPKYESSANSVIGLLDGHIARVAKMFLGAGYHIASTTACSIIGYGDDAHPIYSAIKQTLLNDNPTDPMPGVAQEMPAQLRAATKLANRIHNIVFWRFGDSNTLSYLHVTLVFMHFLSFMSGEVIDFVFREFPWKLLSVTLNTLLESVEEYSAMEAEAFPGLQNTRPLPEDYAMRGLLWTDRYYPDKYFEEDKTDDDEKFMEFPSMELTRKDRVLYLGCRIAAQGGKWLRYESRRFSAAPEFDVKLERRSPDELVQTDAMEVDRDDGVAS